MRRHEVSRSRIRRVARTTHAVGCPADSGQGWAIGKLHDVPVRERETRATLVAPSGNQVHTDSLFDITPRASARSVTSHLRSRLGTSRSVSGGALEFELEVWPSRSGLRGPPTQSASLFLLRYLSLASVCLPFRQL